ncbi:MAG: phosphate signaling complex protein PhoU [Planctomycetota bacterium]|nr:phosphate signaling complex protein PhoU [Planctomycetota bacterium]MDA0934619.1 phosphate signaling complex protein PhoU [Planctomycetota bacterium]MDA1221267.1 phosphate signaling complex protein PhoU [Planctomycetota bacterium]
MSVHLHRDLENLKARILDMGAMVETAVNKAITSLIDRRPELASEVLDGDDAIDECEVAIEVECQKILALHQPVASDLRVILTVLKVNNDLERAGDLAANLAERAADLAAKPALKFPAQLEQMAERTRAILRDSLDAFVQQDTRLAREVRERDDEIDELNREVFRAGEEAMRADGGAINRLLQLLSCARQMERIADLATNIAEDVVFLVEGTVIRHRRQV